jgi:2-polyprenyl-6-methoxyphenol hydroxylase-like FAD-dependent oxidoreductase
MVAAEGVTVYDAIVVGARVAGASTAMLLARRGYDVLLLDRARFPSDTLSTLYIHPPGVARLDAWGVLDDVVKTGCPPLERTIFRIEDICIDGCSLPVNGHREAWAPRRRDLDQILVDAAVAAGAEFRDQCTVTEPVIHDGRVVGVELSSGNGRSSVEKARLVIGADGMRSKIAQRVGAPLEFEDPKMTCSYYSYWDGVPADFELHEAPNRWVGVVPTTDATLIAVVAPQAAFKEIKTDPQRYYLEWLRTTTPELYERAMEGRQVDRMYGSGDQQNFFRRPAGRGWALVGDAAHHKDSITARGISDAFKQAEILSREIGADLRDREALDLALARYSDALLDAMFEGYRNTLSVARLTPTPERLEWMRVVASSARLTSLYFTVAGGAASVMDLHEELQTAMSAAS